MRRKTSLTVPVSTDARADEGHQVGER